MIAGPNIPARRQRGTVIVMAIVVSVIITGLIMVIAYGAAGLSANGSNLVKCDQTYYAAEAGLNTAIWFAKHNSLSAQTQPLTGSAGGINYSVTWNTTGATTLVSSVASSGTVSGSVHATLLGAFLQSSVAYVGGNFDMHNFIVNGDIATAGNITHGGGLDSISSASAFYGGRGRRRFLRHRQRSPSHGPRPHHRLLRCHRPGRTHLQFLPVQQNL